MIDIVHSEDYALVRSTYKKLSTLGKGKIDTKPPETIGLVEKLSKNKKPNNFLNVEHNKNLASLCQHINQIQKRSVFFKKF